MVRTNAVIKSCYFLVSSCSLHFDGLQRLTARWLSVFFFFGPKEKSWVVLHVFFFQYRSSKGLGNINIWLQSFWEKCYATHRFQNYCFARRQISSPLSKISKRFGRSRSRHTLDSRGEKMFVILRPNNAWSEYKYSVNFLLKRWVYQVCYDGSWTNFRSCCWHTSTRQTRLAISQRLSRARRNT